MNKRSVGFKVTALLVSAVLIGVPLLADCALAQANASSYGSSDYAQGRMDGEMDGQNAAGTGWFFAGFCLGAIGVLIAYMVKPTPNTGMLTGKSPEYIRGYIDGYESKGASAQGKKALYGLGASVALTCVIYIVLVALVASSDSDTNGW